jgi:histone-lysine N-methyltransferase SUV420H
MLPGLQRFLAKLTLDAEKKGFRRLLRAYLSLYLPDCPFEISSTNRYTIDTYEAAIISRMPISEGAEIKYLCGMRAILTAEEEVSLDRRGYDFSILETTRNKATSYLFGPASFSNHDCRANSRLTTTGPSGVKIIATRDIHVGEEITVTYAANYFGEDNCECLCKDCEDHYRNGWRSANPTSKPAEMDPDEDAKNRHNLVRSIRFPGDYLTSGCLVKSTARPLLHRQTLQ